MYLNTHLFATQSGRCCLTSAVWNDVRTMSCCSKVLPPHCSHFWLIYNQRVKMSVVFHKQKHWGCVSSTARREYWRDTFHFFFLQLLLFTRSVHSGGVESVVCGLVSLQSLYLLIGAGLWCCPHMRHSWIIKYEGWLSVEEARAWQQLIGLLFEALQSLPTCLLVSIILIHFAITIIIHPSSNPLPFFVLLG